MSEKLSYEEFVTKAIVSLRKEGYKGIHSVYSGFNNAFKKYFDGENPVDVTNRLAKEGKIIIRPVKGGVHTQSVERAHDHTGPAAGTGALVQLRYVFSLVDGSDAEIHPWTDARAFGCLA